MVSYGQYGRGSSKLGPPRPVICQDGSAIVRFATWYYLPGISRRDKPLKWAVGFFFGNTELSLEFCKIIGGISELDD
jgi:hypothetical protein